MMKTWVPPGQPQALLLAATISPADAEHLTQAGLEIHAFEREPSLRELAAEALQLRKRHPRLLLAVAAPERLLRQFQRGYPPLIDVPLTSATPEHVLSALENQGKSMGTSA